MKPIALPLFVFFLTSGALLSGQTTILLPCDTDVSLGYHDHFNTGNINYEYAYQNAAYLRPGDHPQGGLNGNRALIRFDLSVIPPCAIVTSALMNLYAIGPPQITISHTGTNNSAYLQRVTQPWNPLTVTWSNQPTASTQNQVTLPANTVPLQDYTNIVVTQLIQDMISTNNYGFLLRLVNEVVTNALVFASKDFPDSTKHPTLEITYTYPGGSCPSYVFHQQTICEGDSAFLQGDYQKTTGQYFDTLTNIVNLDSIIVTALFVQPPINIIQVHTICHGDSIWLAGAFRKTAGYYPEYFTSQLGCDSIQLNQLVVIILDSTITVTGNTLTANEAGASYQWVDCENSFAPIPGATLQSFTPSSNGNFAVIITKNGCTILTPCVRIGNISVPGTPADKPDIRIIPNPTDGKVFIQLDKRYPEGLIMIQSLTGQKISEQPFNNATSIELNLSGMSKGTYIISIQSDGTELNRKLVVQ